MQYVRFFLCLRAGPYARPCICARRLLVCLYLSLLRPFNTTLLPLASASAAFALATTAIALGLSVCTYSPRL